MTAVASFLLATSFAHAVARVLYLQWQVGVQPVICILLGCAVARHTRRSLLPWLVAGFLSGAVPVAGYLIMAGAWFWYPPAEQHLGGGPAEAEQPADAGATPPASGRCT